MDIVNQVLQRVQKEKEESERSVTVNKLIDLECYLQDLVVLDTNELEPKKLRSEQKEDYLLQLSRDCVQVLCNKLAQCPRETKDGQSFLKLPESAFPLPREKPPPVPKPLTKWERFAKQKGIKKTKKPKVTWDDILQKWVPTYGYKKVAAEKEKEWLLEVPQNKDPNTDMFEEKQKIKKERIAKNEYQRLRNLAASNKIRVPKFGVPPPEGNMHPQQLKSAADVARVSTASVGKFQPLLPKEKVSGKQSGNKKKRPLLDSKAERKANMEAIDAVLKKKPRLNIERAVNKSMNEQEKQRKNEKPEKKGNKKKKRGNKKGGAKNDDTHKTASFKKPSSKGKRAGKTGKSGRKRR